MVMTLFAVTCFHFNEWLGAGELKAIDMGGILEFFGRVAKWQCCSLRDATSPASVPWTALRAVGGSATKPAEPRR